MRAFAFALLVACGGARTTTLAPAATASATTSTAPTPLPVSAGAAYRPLLEQLVSVDTSHGGETKLLEPLAALYRQVGVPVQILESSPGRGNLVARLKGSGQKKPLLLIAHVDVVPTEGQPWTVPPFGITEKDGFLWGRGVNDDKAMAAAIVALTLELARNHTPLTRDVIVALTAGEETGGAAGARWLCDHHKDMLDAEIALNEGGGTLLTDDFSKPVATFVGVSEKTFQSYRLTVKGTGGHSSRPPTTGDPVVTLARALVKVGEYRFPATILPETKSSFTLEAPSAEPELAAALQRAAASAPRVSPADEAILTKEPGYNAEMRTTCVTTMLQGSPQDNVLPTTAEATINCRILPGETRAGTRAALEKIIADPSVGISDLDEVGEAPPSPYEGEVVLAVKNAVAAAFPGTPVAPGMSTGATDSRHLRRIGIHAYGVSPGMFTRAEAKSGHSAHGPDERKQLKWMMPGVELFWQIVRALAT